jgi:hypothetical protein
MTVVRNPPSLPRRWYAPFAIALFGVLVTLSFLVVPGRAAAAPAASRNLIGTLQLTPGSCSGGHVHGTYLRMILPSGGLNGPYMSNSDSTCSDQSFTPLSPGTDGGLRVGSYQPTPSPAFTASGDALARRITAPAAFYGTNFATATSSTDPQTKHAVPAPRLTLTGGTLSADLRSFAVTWNNQNFNQGAPKPDGSTPGNTHKATGTYDAATGAFTLDWTSQVVGGPFDKFTGSWHFEGRFVPAAGTSAPTSTGHGTTGATGATTTGGGTTGTTTTGTGTASVGTPAPTAPAEAGTPQAADPGAEQAATTTTPLATTKERVTDRWKVSLPVIGLAAGIGLLAIGALVITSVLGRRTANAP